MAKVINELGNRYGSLLVIEEAGRDKHKKALWKCKCDCGNEIIVIGSNLRKGNSTTCGCKRLSADLAEIGNQYGMLTVLESAGRTEAKKVLWKCQCSCGNITYATTGALHNGDIVSCGCKNKAIKKNEIGNKYGLLTVIDEAPSRNYNTDAYWLCKCECGNLIEVSGTHLRSGNTKSCGCTHSIGEYNIAHILQENNIKYR